MPKRARGRPAKNIDSQNLKESTGKNVPVVKSEGSFPDNLPEFFQIYFVEKCSQRMRIPPSFMINFDGFVPSIFTFKSTYDDKSWQVHPDMIKRDWYFQKGWPEFVQQNSLQDGDFLTFSYDGSSRTFFVKLFGINGCRKISASATENHQGESRKHPARRSNSRARKATRRN